MSWTHLDESAFSGHEYTNVTQGWRNDETDAEVSIFRTEGTGMEQVTELDWAVQHPIDDEGENTHFFETEEAAEEWARDYIDEHPAPENEY